MRIENGTKQKFVLEPFKVNSFEHETNLKQLISVKIMMV
jgi:hypothetical protein